MSFNRVRTDIGTGRRLNNVQIVEALRREAQVNPAFNAVCHMFALRERARQQVTIGSLTLRMTQEGYNFKKTDYQKILKFLSTLGIGTIDIGPGNEVRALKNIHITLQSIGQAAVADKNVLEKFSPAFDYQRIIATVPPTTPDTTPKAVEAAPLKAKASNPPPAQYPVALTVNIDGKPFTFDLPKGLTTKELGELLAELHKGRA